MPDLDRAIGPKTLNDQLFWEIAKRKRTEERLAKINQCFLEFVTDPLQNIQRLTALCGELMGATCALYNRLHQGMLCSLGRWNTPQDLNPVDKPEGHICYDVIIRGEDKVLVIRDLPETHYAKTDPNVTQYGLRTYIGHPVKFGKNYVGSLCVVYQNDFVPTPEDLWFIGVIASAIGVEENRRGAEDAIKKGERFLASVFDSIQDGLSILDKDFKILRANQAMERWHSYSLPLVGKKCYEAYQRRHERCERCPSHRSIETGEAAHDIVLRTGPAGEVIGWVDLFSFPLLNLETGQTEGVIEYVRDITEQRQAEQAQQRSERKAKRLALENEIIAEIGRIITSTLDIEEVYERFAEEVRKLIPFDRIVVNVINPENNTTIAYLSGVDAQGRQLGATVPLVGTATGECIRTQSSLLFQPESMDEVVNRFSHLLPIFEAGLRSMIFVPLISKDQMIGVLSLQATKPKVHTEADLRLAERVGNQIAGSIANAQLFTEGKRTEEALRKSEERYRTILESIQDGYFEVDLAGSCTFANDARCRSLGYTKEELIGINNQQFTDQENAKKVYQAFNRVYRTGEPVKGLDEEVIRKDGTRAFSEISISLIRDSEGKPIGFRGISRDITERKKMEEELSQSEEKYRNILESIEDGYYEVDLAGNFTFFNDSTCRIWGYPKEELMGMNDRQYTDQENANKLFQAFNKVYTTGEPAEGFDWQIIRKDGIKRYIEASVSLQKDSSGKPIGFRGIIRDITERKRAEEALRQAEEKYRTIFETIIEGIFQTTPDRRFLNVNPAFARMFGYESCEELITSITDIDQQMYVDRSRRVELRRLFSEQEVVKGFEFEAYQKDGSKIWVSTDIRVVRNANGEVLYYEGVGQDITERKRAEKGMAELQEQLRQSQKVEAVGQLAGGIAHDFNNLLTIISGYSQLSLSELRKGEPLRENIEEIQRAAERAAALTRQLLAFSRRQIMEMRVLDLNTVLRDLEKLLRRIIGEDIELIMVLSEDLGRTKADPGQIEQVILNLAVNARDAMPAGGKFILETSNAELDEECARSHISVTPGHYVSICVSDTGAGMSMEVKERIFEPFFTTKEFGKGTGLGLSTVYGIVKQSGGDIWAYSEVDRGTTFKIYFPRLDEVSDASRLGSAPSEILRGSETILLVEDEEAVRTLARKTLESRGYSILEACNGHEALRVVQEHPGKTIHLLLTDVVMPGMGGRDLADQLVRSHPELEVLFMSGYTDDAIVHHGVLHPGIHFLQKPFSPQFLVQKVQETLRNGSKGIGSPE